ncbi:hypothetical protein PENTCL1PPCAC_27369, partial [Pristionchus entomophagus]
DNLLSYQFWQPTVLRVSYKGYAVRNTIVALITLLPVLLLFHCISLFPNAFKRYKPTIVFTTICLLLFTFLQHLFHAMFALLVWSDTFIPMGVCSIIKNFTYYLAQAAYSSVPVSTVIHRLTVRWE